MIVAVLLAYHIFDGVRSHCSFQLYVFFCVLVICVLSFNVDDHDCTSHMTYILIMARV